MNKDQEVISFLIHNSFEMKLLTADLTKQYNNAINNEDKIFSDDIKNQYISKVKSIISDEISRNLGIDAETSNIVLDNLNIMEYLSL